MSKDDGRMFGLLEVSALEGEYISARNWTVQVGVRRPDHSIPKALTLGSRVLVCSNLCFHEELGVFSTWQTLRVWDRLRALVKSAFDTLPQLTQRNEQRFDRYRTFDLKPRQGDAALVELHGLGVFSAGATRLPRKYSVYPSAEKSTGKRFPEASI